MLTEVHTKYRIQNIDDINDFIEVESNGTGVDTQDKGVGKAMTYAYKYMLLRTFAIPTGEDPDKISSAEIDSKVEKEVQEAGNKIINRNMQEGLISAIENKNIADTIRNEILQKFGYTEISQIKVKDYMNVVNEFKKLL